MFSLAILLLIQTLSSSEGRALRLKRDSDLPDYRLPPDYYPYPGRSASDMFPLFPFTHQFQMGLTVGSGSTRKIKGHLDIPIPGWNGIFDLKGALSVGKHTRKFGYGHIIRPLNMLNISPEAASLVVSNPVFQQARRQAKTIPVANLPGNFQPIHCKPPLCNPFVHNVGVGVEYEPGDGPLIKGSLDFPIPLWAPGGGVRFPLAGGLDIGTPPIGVKYGHVLSPVDPFQQPATQAPLVKPSSRRRLPQLPDFGRFPTRRVSTFPDLPTIPFEGNVG